VSIASQDRITITALRSRFDGYAEYVLPLTGFLLELPRNSKYTVRSYRITRALPSLAEYGAIRDALYQQPIERAIKEAVFVAQSVRGELQEWFDALPSQIQLADKGLNLKKGVDHLREVEESTPPRGMDKLDVKVIFLPNHNARTKAERLLDASKRLRAVVTALRVAKQNLLEDEKDMEDELLGYAKEIERLQNAIERVKIPSAF
jgi:hypothetical protein